jgi:hypothetical protein
MPLLQITLAAMNVYLRPDAQRLLLRDFAPIKFPKKITTLFRFLPHERERANHTTHEQRTKHLALHRAAKRTTRDKPTNEATNKTKEGTRKEREKSNRNTFERKGYEAIHIIYI